MGNRLSWRPHLLALRPFQAIVVLSAAALCLGCAEQGVPSYAPAGTAGEVVSADSYDGGSLNNLKQVGLAQFNDKPTVAAPPPAGEAPAGAKAADQPPTDVPDSPTPMARKIVYNAQVSLIVENLTAVEQKVSALVKDVGGYIADTESVGNAQRRRRATWKARVPVEKFDSFLAAVVRMGELERNHVDSQDVTQEFYDIEARIKNKQQEERRLQKHLDESTGKLADILAVERELARVRGEIEQMQGRIRYLANVSALSTVTITATEIKNYTPPVAPTFAAQIGRTFSGSVEKLVNFGRTLVLAVVAITPWLPVLFVFALVLVWVGRRLKREWRARVA
jgi:hypothetical protein